jgi:hypothetical protein
MPESARESGWVLLHTPSYPKPSSQSPLSKSLVWVRFWQSLQCGANEEIGSASVPPRRLKTFKANEAFQKRIRESGVKDHVPTKIVTLKVRLGDGEHVNPGVRLFQEGKIRAG